MAWGRSVCVALVGGVQGRDSFVVGMGAGWGSLSSHLIPSHHSTWHPVRQAPCAAPCAHCHVPSPPLRRVLTAHVLGSLLYLSL
ncbi:hypothetical protein CLOM_g21577 [Closterium sp. NIES-68]|nr:hypothetical protein CLOM_g21577 [Closterium sp. NIES-68]